MTSILTMIGLSSLFRRWRPWRRLNEVRLLQERLAQECAENRLLMAENARLKAKLATANGLIDEQDKLLGAADKMLERNQRAIERLREMVE